MNLIANKQSLLNEVVKTRILLQADQEFNEQTNSVLSKMNLKNTETMLSTSILSTSTNVLISSSIDAYLSESDVKAAQIENKTGYIFAFVFIFIIVLMAIVARVIYSANETPSYLIYLKYSRAMSTADSDINNPKTDQNQDQPGSKY